jgi:DNA-binding response OmpR family regulator
MDTRTLLVVEDDPVVRAFLTDNLVADGYDVLAADSLRDALRMLDFRRPDLAVVDIGLPDGSGLELVSRIRSADRVASRIDPALPLILLTGRASELDRMRGFERGCDDYVAKPFGYGELRLRIQAVLRRARGRPNTGLVTLGDLEVDPLSREVRYAGVRVAVSQKEFALLLALAAEPTRVFTKDELLRDVWGFRAKGNTRTLDSHACRLRHKLAAHGGRYVVNVWGVGYRLLDGPPAPADPEGGRTLTASA